MSSSAPSGPRVWAALAVLTLVWGTTWAAIRIGLEGTPPFAGVAFRFGIASAVLLGVAAVARIPLGRTRTERRLWLVNGFFSFVFSYGLVYWAEQWVPSALAAILFATFPLFVVLVGLPVLPGERLGTRALLGLLGGFAGVVLIFSEDLATVAGSGVVVASLVFLGSPVTAAIGSVAIKRWGKGIHPISMAAVPMGICAVVMGLVSFLFERDRTFVWDGTSVGAILYLGVLGSAVTFVLYFWLLEHLPVTQVSLVTYVTPIVAVGVGTLWLDEPFTARMALGTILVIAGVAVTSTRRGRATPRGRTPAG